MIIASRGYVFVGALLASYVQFLSCLAIPRPIDYSGWACLAEVTHTLSLEV